MCSMCWMVASRGQNHSFLYKTYPSPEKLRTSHRNKRDSRIAHKRQVSESATDNDAVAITISANYYDMVGSWCITICILLYYGVQMQTSLSHFGQAPHTARNHARSQPW